MGFNFRKSLKIAPGVRLNITKNGISSISLGTKGAKVNLGKKGTRTTVGLPGTGMSYSSFSPKRNTNVAPRAELSSPVGRSSNLGVPTLPFMPNYQRKMSPLLFIGILLMPYFFVWFTLRDGYSKTARYISFIWLFFVVFASMQKS